MARFFVVGVFFCLLGSPAQAEWKASVNADATVEGMDWTNGPLAPDNHVIRDIFTLKIPATIKNGRTLKFRFLPLVQADPETASRTDPQHPDRNERVYWDFQEAYMQLQSNSYTLQLGMNVQTWGDTDVFNPLDVVNSRRYYDPLRSEKIGAGTVLVKKEWEKLFVELLYIPIQPETLLPGEQSRWLPRDIYKSRSFEGQPFTNGTTLSGVVNLPSNLQYHYGSLAVLNAANRDNFGGRVKFRLPGFDWTLAGFRGAANSPAVNLTNISLAPTVITPGTTALDLNVLPDVYLQALYFKNRMLGTSFVWSVGEFLIKGASAQNHVVSQLDGVLANRLPKDDWENALGAEHTFTVGSGTLTAIAQGTYVKRNEALDTNSVSLARMFDRAGMIALRWAPGEKWSILGSVLYDIQYKGNFEHAEVSYKITDGWTSKLSGDALNGAAETPIGTYRRNDRVIISLNVQK
ncbi:MAG: hypothetical protein ACXVCI_00625 [Bdellovibrionota bacterium]